MKTGIVSRFLLVGEGDKYNFFFLFCVWKYVGGQYFAKYDYGKNVF